MVQNRKHSLILQGQKVKTYAALKNEKLQNSQIEITAGYLI